MKKNTLLAIATCLVCTLSTPVAVYAVENNASTATSLFDDLKEKYTDLGANFGNVVAPDTSGFNAYLEGIQNNAESLEINKNLDAIKNFDFSTKNNKYIDAIWGSAVKDSEKLKVDSKDLAAAFDKKYAEAQLEAKNKEEAGKNAGGAEYEKGMNEYNSMKETIDDGIASAQSKYAEVKGNYQNAISKKGSLSGKFSEYSMPKFSDKNLTRLAKEIGVVTQDKENKTNAKKQVVIKDTVSKNKTKLYTSNAYQSGIGA